MSAVTKIIWTGTMTTVNPATNSITVWITGHEK